MKTFVKFPWAVSDEYRTVVFMDEVNQSKHDLLDLIKVQESNKGYLDFDPRG